MATNSNYFNQGTSFPAAKARGRSNAPATSTGDEDTPLHVVVKEPKRGLIFRTSRAISWLLGTLGAFLGLVVTVITLVDRGVIIVPDSMRTWPGFSWLPAAPLPPVEAAANDAVKVLARLTELQGRALFAREKLVATADRLKDNWRPIVAESSQAVAQGSRDVLAALNKVRQFDRASARAALDKVAASRDGNAEERAMLASNFDQWFDADTIRRDTERLGQVHLDRRGVSAAPTR